jgi:hypothetical protein
MSLSYECGEINRWCALCCRLPELGVMPPWYCQSHPCFSPAAHYHPKTQGNKEEQCDISLVIQRLAHLPTSLQWSARHVPVSMDHKEPLS